MTEILIGAMCIAIILVFAAVLFWVAAMVILGAEQPPSPWDEPADPEAIEIEEDRHL